MNSAAPEVVIDLDRADPGASGSGPPGRPGRRPRSGRRRPPRPGPVGVAIMVAAVLLAIGSAIVRRLPPPDPPGTLAHPLWMTTAPGTDLSLGSEHVYVFAADDKTLSAYATSTGALTWQRRFDAPVRAVVELTADAVAVATSAGRSGQSFLIDPARGSMIGAISGIALASTAGPDPLVISALDNVGLGCPIDCGYLVGTSRRSGREHWLIPTEGGRTVRWSATALGGVGAVVELGPGRHLRLLELADGSTRVSQPLTPQMLPEGAIVVAAQIVGDLFIVVALGPGGQPAEAVSAFSLADGAPRWTTQLARASRPDPVDVVACASLVCVVNGSDTIGLEPGTGRQQFAARGAAATRTVPGGPLLARDRPTMQPLDPGPLYRVDPATGVRSVVSPQPLRVIADLGPERGLLLTGSLAFPAAQPRASAQVDVVVLPPAGRPTLLGVLGGSSPVCAARPPLLACVDSQRRLTAWSLGPVGG